MEEPYDPRDFNLIRPYGSPVTFSTPFPLGHFLWTLSSSHRWRVGYDRVARWKGRLQIPPCDHNDTGVYNGRQSSSSRRCSQPEPRHRLRSHPDLRL